MCARYHIHSFQGHPFFPHLRSFHFCLPFSHFVPFPLLSFLPFIPYFSLSVPCLPNFVNNSIGPVYSLRADINHDPGFADNAVEVMNCFYRCKLSICDVFSAKSF